MTEAGRDMSRIGRHPVQTADRLTRSAECPGAVTATDATHRTLGARLYDFRGK